MEEQNSKIPLQRNDMAVILSFQKKWLHLSLKLNREKFNQWQQLKVFFKSKYILQIFVIFDIQYINRQFLPTFNLVLFWHMHATSSVQSILCTNLIKLEAVQRLHLVCALTLHIKVKTFRVCTYNRPRINAPKNMCKLC